MCRGEVFFAVNGQNTQLPKFAVLKNLQFWNHQRGVFPICAGKSSFDNFTYIRKPKMTEMTQMTDIPPIFLILFTHFSL